MDSALWDTNSTNTPKTSDCSNSVTSGSTGLFVKNQQTSSKPRNIAARGIPCGTGRTGGVGVAVDGAGGDDLGLDTPLVYSKSLPNIASSGNLPYYYPNGRDRSANYHHFSPINRGLNSLSSPHGLTSWDAANNSRRRRCSDFGSGRSLYHMPRDPAQPSTGSISDVHQTQASGDESDTFNERGLSSSLRLRCSACSDGQRRSQIRCRKRPLTPPPPMTSSEADGEPPKGFFKHRPRGLFAAPARRDCIPESPPDLKRDLSSTSDSVTSPPSSALREELEDGDQFIFEMDT